MKLIVLFISILLICITNESAPVVFRLDNIQDTWMSQSQQTVISKFVNDNIPLTIGIIANFFGNDNSMLPFISSIMDHIEIAGNGFMRYHNHNPINWNC